MSGAFWRTSEAAFATWALNVLREEFSSLSPRPVGADVIEISGTRIGLQNARAAAAHSDADEKEIREMLVERVRRLVQPEPVITTVWSDAQPTLRLQLMPAEYVQQAPLPLITRPFHGGILIGVVADQTGAYSYVRTEDARTWLVTEEQIWKAAEENLDAASKGLQAHVAGGADRWIAVAMGDGYDAARILLPNVRAFLVERLGEPFYAGTPNRDFLIAWAANCTNRFWEFVREKLAKDSREQPYPLTDAITEATHDEVRAASH